MSAPVPGTYPAFFEKYIHLVRANSVEEACEKYSGQVQHFFMNLPAEQTDYRYAAGKWSIKEMLQHIIDAERIFAYRALRIARGDKTPLPGFDEVAYAAFAHAADKNWTDLLAEFEAVRRSTDLLLKSLHPEDLEKSGTTNGQPNTSVAIAFVVYGHILHHINVLKERYL